jgi:hypothetical protein
MKRVMAPVFVAVVCLATAVLAAENVGGTWKWTTSFGGKTRESTLKLKQDGDKVSGVYVGGQGNNETPIEDAKLDGDTISFKVTRERDGQKFATKYSGKVAGDTITGKSERQRDGQAQSNDWVAKRQK